MSQSSTTTPDARASRLVDLFARYLEHVQQITGEEDRRGVARHLVIIATLLRGDRRLDTATALRLTVRAYGAYFGPPASTLKKCASEARALLAARDEKDLSGLRAKTGFAAIEEIDGQIRLESAQAAAALRAARLSGRRGGRPPRNGGSRRNGPDPAVPPERIARAIVALKERARAGDEYAQFSLEKLKRLIV